MIPARIENPTATLAKPAEWNDEQMGHCGGLSVRVEEVHGIRFMRSAWDLEPDEIMHLVAGGKLVLGISAPRHPVVHLLVEPAPQQLTRTTVVRELINGKGELTVLVETLFPPVPGVEGGFSNRVRCEALVGADGAPKATASAMSEIEKLAIERGWIVA